LEVIPEAEMPEATDQAIRRLLCECFPADAEAFSRSRAWHESAPTFSVVLREGGAVRGHVGIVLRAVRCGQTPVTVAGVQSLCVAPALRGSGLSRELMARAFDEATERGVRFGLLFCVPELDRFYSSMGWSRTDEPATMLDEHGRSAPIPAKNIPMYLELSDDPFPRGPIDLEGRDW
jgi:predicted N-acetyltransferase YhbS